MWARRPPSLAPDGPEPLRLTPNAGSLPSWQKVYTGVKDSLVSLPVKSGLRALNIEVAMCVMAPNTSVPLCLTPNADILQSFQAAYIGAKSPYGWLSAKDEGVWKVVWGAREFKLGLVSALDVG